MTLFIILTATTNIILGYALAVYLGQGQLPWRLKRPTKKRAVAQPVEEVTEEPVQESAPSVNQFESTPTLEDTVEQLPQGVVEPAKAKAETKTEPAPVESVEQVSQSEEMPIAELEEVATATAETASAATEDDLPDSSLSAASETVAPEEQASNSEDEKASPADEADARADVAIADKASESSSEPHDKASLDETETPTSADPTLDAEEGDSEELLAGIESFRAQLAGMQGTDESSPEDADSEEAKDSEEAEVVS